MKQIEQVTLRNGVKLYPFSSNEELIDFVSNEKKILVAVNAEKILHATEQTKSIINNNIGYSDGIGAVMALQKHGFANAKKLPGCELWLKIIESLFQQGKTFYLVGSKQEVIETTVRQLKQDFAGIQIVGFRNGYIQNDDEKKQLISDIVEKKPDVVFVAMGSPKQELLMEEMLQQHKAIYQGLGGSFDVYTGNVKRAPQWWVSHNLEFAYRLLKQPTRIKRQIHLVKFLLMVKLGRF
ncbi:MAG: WecB/TagA/CpsF family glycosyltransferase [Bacteroidales bacterium]|nr:WecB/TagA/CpsF family glycosyltransferase [Bacteroidales bacterium]